MTRDDPPFWETKALAELTREQWESLCDGCGRCCLVVLEDEDHDPKDPESTAYLETSVCCQLFDPQTRQCTRYADRRQHVPGCVRLTASNVAALSWMPDSCAYRRLAKGRGLAPWHPLISGRRDSVVEAGIAVSADLTNERRVAEEDLWLFVTGAR